MILYGTNPIAWANDDDQSIGAHIPTEQILTEAGRIIGFDGIENGHRWPEDPQALKTLLADYGLRFISGWYSTELLVRSVEAEIAAVQPHLAKLKANDCKVCIVCETSNAVHGSDVPVNDRARLTPAEMAAFGAKIEAFAAYLAGEGITLAYHHHMGTVVETPEEIDAFMAATGPATHLLFDAGHCTFGGGDPAAVLARHVGRVAHFHAKNIRRDICDRVRTEGLSFIEGVLAGAFTVPGDPEGAVDFVPLLRLLAGAGYDGWLVIEAEQDPVLRNPLTYQSMGLHALKAAAREAGLDRSATACPKTKGTPMPHLLRRPFGTHGETHRITPGDAGWRYVGYALHRLRPGEQIAEATGDREVIVVMVEGKAAFTAAGQDWGVLGDRMDVFEKTPPHCLYVPNGQDWAAEAVTDCTIAVCSAPGRGGHPARRIGPDGISLTPRGKGTNTRHINNIAMEAEDYCDSLLVTEVFTPAGHWSSYPSHRHDEDDFPRITYLEETYYHRLNPADGWAVQRVYTDDGSLDEVMAVRNHDVVLVPRGHHPCGAPYGFELYYLNVMAGPRRNWRFVPAPEVEAILARDA